MEISLNDLEISTILRALEAIYDKIEENSHFTYDDKQDILIELNTIRNLQNKLFMQMQNEWHLGLY